MTNGDAMTVEDSMLVVAPLSEVPPGEGRTFQVGGIPLAIFHSRTGEVFATQASCPHRNGPLADGLVGGNTLVCPLHGWKFDLRSGEPLLGSCPIRIYPARLDAQQRVVVTISSSAG
jgi:nitrite reductase (NADH) small subunit